MSEIKYEIVKKIGVLSKAGPALRSPSMGSRAERSGWAKELNLISWNDREPKYDLRSSSPKRS